MATKRTTTTTRKSHITKPCSSYQLGSARDAGKVPTVEFAGKARVLGTAREESRHDLFGKELAVANDKATAVGQPTNGIVVTFIQQDGHQALRKDVLIVIIAIVLRLFHSHSPRSSMRLLVDGFNRSVAHVCFSQVGKMSS